MPDRELPPHVVAAARSAVADARARLTAGVLAGDVDAAWAAALEALSARGRFGIRLGLARARTLLRALDSPEAAVRGALVAGTNGKGSVVALVSAALQAEGIRHATTPKPHLVSYRERVQIDGRPLAPLPFARAVERSLDAADRIEARVGPATEFELLVGAMFVALRDASISMAIVEVGLGGRLDATHAWDGGVAVVTNVGLDHQQYLGDTIEQIAGEKAAIIVRGDHAVTGATLRGGALDAVRHRAQRVGARLTIASPLAVRSRGREGIEVDLAGRDAVYVGLLGAHQAANAAVAAATLDALAESGIARVSEASLRAGFAAARWPGRLELIPAAFGSGDARDLLLDGAHNVDGATALAAALDTLLSELRDVHGGVGTAPTLVLAAMADKDIAQVCAALTASATLRTARVICTSVGDPRSASPEQVASTARAAGLGATVEVAATPINALQAARQTPGPLIVAGSLYLVGSVRADLLRSGAIPDDGTLDHLSGSRA